MLYSVGYMEKRAAAAYFYLSRTQASERMSEVYSESVISRYAAAPPMEFAAAANGVRSLAVDAAVVYYIYTRARPALRRRLEFGEITF